MSNIIKDTHKKYFCYKCILFFNSEEALKKHQISYKDCNNKRAATSILPNPDEAFVEFKHFNYKFRCPFVIYADFEAILIKPEENNNNITHNHKPCSFMFNVVSTYDEYKFKPVFLQR
jgi:hypothetical protein